MKLTAIAFATLAIAGLVSASTFQPRDVAFILNGALALTLHHIQSDCGFKMIGQTHGESHGNNYCGNNV